MDGFVRSSLARSWTGYARQRASPGRQYLPRAVYSTPRSVWTRSVVSIYAYVCMLTHVRVFGVHIYIYIYGQGARERTYAHSRNSRRQTRIAVYTTTEYCIMQPLIAVLSFTHAICCSRCNPCPVTASSVQSPSRWVSTRFIFPGDIRGVVVKTGRALPPREWKIQRDAEFGYDCENNDRRAFSGWRSKRKYYLVKPVWLCESDISRFCCARSNIQALVRNGIDWVCKIILTFHYIFTKLAKQTARSI